jgi:hypothetical protein
MAPHQHFEESGLAVQNVGDDLLIAEGIPLFQDGSIDGVHW